MKVVLFCGGLGTRLREFSDTIPKPLVNIGYRPIIWHLMKFYAHYGHNDFVLCQGYRGDMIKEYFLNYDPYKGIDFSMTDGGQSLKPAISDIHDWAIQFCDTGLHSNIGQRLCAIRHHVKDEPVFLANYADQLSDIDLSKYIDSFMATDAIAGFVTVKPSQSFHTVEMDSDNQITGINDISNANIWINGGYLILRQEIFDYINEGEELVEEPFQRLIQDGLLFGYKHEGFWKAMDTFKDKITYERMDGQGDRPWAIWED
ncbi:MAG: sugar phosphate nucleotidyltransferase [Gammaproteobacteria bacterium]|nr:sugar phosphate nucleotidyltransferase [Gammaproteobacteria bacterium]